MQPGVSNPRILFRPHTSFSFFWVFRIIDKSKPQISKKVYHRDYSQQLKILFAIPLSEPLQKFQSLINGQQTEDIASVSPCPHWNFSSVQNG
jgi:hypothetical protein